MSANAWAGFCGNYILVSLVKNSDGTSTCSETAPDYPYTLDSGCSVSSKSVVGCLYVYKICCGDTSKQYEDSTTSTLLAQSIDVGREEEAAASKYEEFKTSAVAPICADGFKTTSEMLGYVYYVTPSYSTGDYTKSDVSVSAWNRVGCSKFTNTTTVTLNPVSGSGTGGTTAITSEQLDTTNSLLTDIKFYVNSIPKTDTSGTLTDIKNLLSTGLNFNSSNMESLLTDIKDKLQQACTTTQTYLGVDLKGNPIYSTSTSCSGLSVSDSATQSLLTDVKSSLSNLSTGGTGGTVDMTETNTILTGSKSFLSDIKDFFSGSSSLSQYSDSSASKAAYSSSYLSDSSSVPTLDSYETAFSDFTNNMKTTSLYGLMGSFFTSVPNSGSSIVSFDGGVYGSHSYDFSSWSSIMSVIKAFVLITFAAISLKIIFLKGGSG